MPRRHGAVGYPIVCAMKILTFSTLYPNAARPIHGIFVETRLRELLASGQIESKVVAPVPWFPWRHPRFGEYARHASTPREERRHGIEVFHPRYPVIPKVGMTAAPFLLAQAAKATVRRVLEDYDFDLIDTHYFYPDGVAAVMLGKRLNRPVVVTARGSDVNLIARYCLPRAMIRWTARNAAGIIAVSQALKDSLVRLGVPAARIEVLRNGVDLDFFKPVEREAVRARLGMTRKTLLSVGNLLAFKGHGLAIWALSFLPQCDLIVIGDGPDRMAFEALARDSGLGERVRFVGSVPQAELREYYGAADALVLASSREGWPNVLLEAMACGTPVVATDVGGVSEVVAAPEAGLIIEERSATAVVGALRRLFDNPPDRAATRRYAEQFSWAPTTKGQLKLFEEIISASSAVPEMHAARTS